MKKHLSLIFLLLLSATAFSQNYNCFQPGNRNFFINGNNYLRGMRIDSVRSNIDTTFYYPYHSTRGNYNAYPYQPTLDSTGGSWLGKKVISLADGTYWFDNIWQDTCTIKTMAAIGDSWVFFNDTTTRYYMALMQSTDTMTVLGSLDSTKTILITAHDVSGLVQDDPVDSFQIVLSKNHGFVQVFDLYTFPYHKPDTAASPYGPSGFDYYFDELTYSDHPYINYYPLYYGINKNTLTFKIVTFQNPTNEEMSNWNVGDVYEYTSCPEWAEMAHSDCNPYHYADYDSITSKTDYGDHVMYKMQGLTNKLTSDFNGWGTPVYITYNHSDSATFNDQYFSDTVQMPEEYSSLQYPALKYYYPSDTSFCVAGPKYMFLDNYMWGIHYYAPFEGWFQQYILKLGIGLLHEYHLSLDAGFTVYDKTLVYCKRNEQSCGNYINLSTPSVSAITDFKIFPNPADDVVELACEDGTLYYSYSLYNMLGQCVRSKENNNGKQSINVRSLPAGIYNLNVSENGNKIMNEKIVVTH